MRPKASGFTLVEILVTLVIVTILASLTVPRFINQSKQGLVAEAMGMLGSIRSRQLTQRDLGTRFLTVFCTPDTECGTAAGNHWTQIGMQDIPAGAHFIYTCPDTGTGSPVFCMATPFGKGAPRGQISIDLASGRWSCSGPTYKNLPDNKGCTLA